MEAIIKQHIQRVFGFIPMESQIRALQCVINRNDCILNAQTGFGKSLIYQVLLLLTIYYCLSMNYCGYDGTHYIDGAHNSKSTANHSWLMDEPSNHLWSCCGYVLATISDNKQESVNKLKSCLILLYWT